MPKTTAQRFKEKVQITENGCHEWQGWVAPNGYGQVGINKKLWYAHRAAWMLTFSDPGDNYVLHKCDNRRCVNPDHLFLGSFQDNMDDMKSKKRQNFGTRNGHAKLTDEKAREILRSNESLPILAERYGITPVSAWQVRHRKTWKHVSI